MENTLTKASMATMALITQAVFFSGHSFAEAPATVLNHNFESDTLPIETQKNRFITGWQSIGSGEVGVYAPQDGTDYTNTFSQSQVGYLQGGGKFRQGLTAQVSPGETYTLTFDVGRPFSQASMFVAAKITANSFTLAQTAINHTQVSQGEWQTHSITFTADDTMPVSSPLVVEFQNQVFSSTSQVDIDNVKLTATGGLPSTRIVDFTHITEPTTLSIPSEYEDINHALAYLNDKIIANDTVVTIQVDDCSNQTYQKPIEIIHPNGKQIEIIGNVANPASCVLEFEGSSGFEISFRRKLRLLNGFHIKGNRVNTTHGIKATKGASIRLGSSTIISGFYNGIEATLNGRVYANTVLISKNAGSGIMSKYSGYVQANGAQSKENDLHGFYALDGGMIEANQSKSLSNNVHGFYSNRFGHIQSQESESSGNLDRGFFATGKSFLDATSSMANNNATGFSCDFSGFLKREGVTVSGNITDYSPLIRRYKNACYIY